MQNVDATKNPVETKKMQDKLQRMDPWMARKMAASTEENTTDSPTTGGASKE